VPVRAFRTRISAVALPVLLVVLGAAGGCSASGQAPPVNSGSTGPSASPAPEGTSGFTPSADPSGEAAAIAAGLSDVDLIGQVLMPAVNLDDPVGPSAALVREHHLGGVIVMNQPPAGADTGDTVRALATALQKAGAALPVRAPVLVATDQEYGWVTRLRSDVVQLPSAMAFGAAGRPDLTEAAWRGAGAELAAVGINVDFAPDADVLGSPSNQIIGSRSFGSDPKAVAAQVAAAVRGLQASGVAATVKHFPGHGHTTVDSHSALPVLSQSRASLGAADLPPFQAGIDVGAMLVMAGHLEVRSVDPKAPATFSHKVLTDLLRTQLGFTGVTVTDALNMAPAKVYPPGDGAVRSLLAGADLLLMPVDLNAAAAGLRSALGSGRLPRARLLDAATRVIALRLRLAGQPAPADRPAEAAAHQQAARAVAAAAVTVVRGACAGPQVKGPVRITAAEGRQTQAQWLRDALTRAGVTVVPTGGSRVHLVGYLDGTGDLAKGAAVTVAMDTPYVLRHADSKVLIATYSSTKVAMEALADVLAGKATPAGRLPVAVSGLPRSVC
jgi:beta-N-acetylhexosaminidase